MSRVIGTLFAIALFAAPSVADEDRSAYAAAQARLTEQLNAVIANRVVLEVDPGPPAKRDDEAAARLVEPADRRASR